jgi:transposase-like protein
VRLDRKATLISLLVVLDIRCARRCATWESEAAWRSLLDDLIGRGLSAPSFVILDGAVRGAGH